MKHAPLIAVPVTRDNQGFWSHPGMPVGDAYCEGERFLFEEFERDYGMKLEAVRAEEQMSFDAYDALMNAKDYDITPWEPTPPAGDGWFTLEIFDTEDGPVAVFARAV